MANSSLSSLFIILAIYFLLMVVLCLCKRRFPRYRAQESIRPTVGSRMSRRGNRGLKPAVIETFPTFPYSVVKEHKYGKGALECAVCLNEFLDDEIIRLLPKCDHAFHSECIDVWLSNRTTCPVCRANLVPESAQTNAITAVQIQELEGESSETVENQQVSIHVTSEEELPREVAVAVVAPEVIDPVQIPVQKGTSGKFPRSHSTGHSLVQPGEDIERFTLRLPDDVRKQIMKRMPNRTSSMGLLPRVKSSRRGYPMSGEGSSRGRREGWVLSMMPSFMRRPSPAQSPRMTAEEDGTVTLIQLSPFGLRCEAEELGA